MNLISKLSLIFLLLNFLVSAACHVNKESQNSNEIDCIKLVEKLGDKVPESLAKCMEQKDARTVLFVRDFLIEKGYEVETKGELNPSFKRALTQYIKDAGLSMHVLGYEFNTAFDIDEELINKEFCRCVKKELK